MKIQKTFPNQLNIGVAYIYGSLDMQDATRGIDAQLRQIKARAAQDGVEIVEVYIDQKTATKARSSLETLLADAKSGKFEVLYCHRLDRLSRKLHYVIEIIRQLNSNDVVIRTTEQNLDTKSPEGKLILHMLIALGNYWTGLPDGGE